MKKVILPVIIMLSAFFITGCESKYQISDLKLTQSLETTNSNKFDFWGLFNEKETKLERKVYVIGSFKNNSSKACKNVQLNIDIISGNLKINDNILIDEKIESNEIKKIRSYCSKCDNLLNFDNIIINVKNIKCNE